MPESSSDPNDGERKSSKRNIPSWMGSKDGEDNSGKKKHTDTHEKTQEGPDFSKLLDGVVFVLSGFVNPERSTLRSQALDMGAVYRPDWTSDCTLLVCAFANTPKFRQVAADNGTIVSKEWISESHSQRKLVDIEPYLMHVGKPWRKYKELVESDQDHKKPHREHQKQVEQSKSSPSSSIKAGHSDAANKHFSPSKIKQWAMDDFARTVLWLESQEEKPEPNELKAVAAEGVITCLQDAIESLKQGNKATIDLDGGFQGSGRRTVAGRYHAGGAHILLRPAPFSCFSGVLQVKVSLFSCFSDGNKATVFASYTLIGFICAVAYGDSAVAAVYLN